LKSAGRSKRALPEEGPEAGASLDHEVGELRAGVFRRTSIAANGNLAASPVVRIG